MTDNQIYSRMQLLAQKNVESALCIVVKTRGSTPRKSGAKMIVEKNGQITGSIGGGELEKIAIKDAIRVISNNTPQMFTHNLVNDHGMCCGGNVLIYIEPIKSVMNLYIFGAGHIGFALAAYANNMGFKVTVIDDRLEFIRKIELPQIKTLNLYHHAAFDALAFNKSTFICVVTHNHIYDREVVAYCAKQPHAYLGMIGSQRKVEMAKKLFKKGNVLTEAEMGKIDWPMGININAQTPEEIAISILAKLIDVKNRL